VTKPFVMTELLARLRAKLRRQQRIAAPGQPARPVIGHWQVDLASYRITAASSRTTRPAPATC
jgi:DNA-binding response OmpR family regulator